jgi:hypothetical protein
MPNLEVQRLFKRIENNIDRNALVNERYWKMQHPSHLVHER